MAVKARAEITLSYMIDIKATYRYFLLQSSTLAKPAKPTTNPPASNWSDSEPTYTVGSTSSLYYVDLTVFSNDTFLYSSVSLSTSYEAAKQAYNKAQNAQDTAESAKDTADNAQDTANDAMDAAGNAQDSADNAAKVATNYMYQDSENGLQIGDRSTGQWQGYRTQVKSDSFNVLDADGNTLSTFGANNIDLGNNSEDTEISMCNGKGRIYVDANPNDPTYNSLYLRSDSLTLFGTDILMHAWNRDSFYDNPQTVEGILAAMVERIGSISAKPDSFLLHSGKAIWDAGMQYMGGPEVSIRGETGKLNLFANEGITFDGVIEGDIRPEMVEISATGTTDAALQAIYDNMYNGSFKTIRLAQSVQDSLPIAGTWFVTIYKTNANYGVIKAIRYYSTTSPYTIEYRRSIYDGTWSPWEQVGLPTETGTWTAKTNGGSITTQKCTYMKVGNMCTISFFIQGVGGTGTANTNFYFSGAPFTPASGATWYGGGGHVQGLYDMSGYPVTGCIIQSGRVYFRTSKAGAADTGYIRVNNGGAAYYLSGTITYPID